MSALCLTCWRQVIPSSAIHFEDHFEDPYQGWPPIKLYPDGHLDLEFGPFLLADYAIMDELSYERLTAAPPAGVERAIHSIRVLREEGYIQLADYRETLKPRTERWPHGRMVTAAMAH